MKRYALIFISLSALMMAGCKREEPPKTKKEPDVKKEVVGIFDSIPDELRNTKWEHERKTSGTIKVKLGQWDTLVFTEEYIVDVMVWSKE